MTDPTGNVDLNDGNTGGTSEDKLFTQADLDKKIGERLFKEKAKYEKEADAKVEASRLANLSEAEQKIETAKAEAREAVRLEYGEKLANSAVRVALAGIVDADKLDEVVGDLDLRKYVNDGEVDQGAVDKLRKRYVDLLGNKKAKSTFQPGRTDTAKTQESKQSIFSEFRASLDK